MPRLSIVIPCLGGANEFDNTLVSVLQNRPANCEVLVVHTEPYDDPYRLGHEVSFLATPTARSLVELINAAIGQSSGEIVHILGCEMEVAEGWATAALEHFRDGEVAAVSPIVLADDGQTLAAAGVRWSLGGARIVVNDQRILNAGAGRLRTQIAGPTLAAGFFRRDVLTALDGFEAILGDELADAGLALDLQALGRLHVCEPGSRVIERACRIAVPARPFHASRASQRLFMRHVSRLGFVPSLLMHCGALTLGALRSAGRPAALLAAFGRLLGTCDWSGARQHRQRLATAEMRLADAASVAVKSSHRISRPAASPTTATSYRRAA